MVGVFAKSPGGRAGTRLSKHFLEDRVGIKRISPAAALQNETPFDSFEPAEVLEEPFELDQPVDCPSPEPRITEDGIMWRGSILESLRRRNDFMCASKEREYVLRGERTPNRRTYTRSSEHFLFVAHSAPEYEVRKLLE